MTLNVIPIHVNFNAILFPLSLKPLHVLQLQRVYVATTRQLKRLESISRSPIYTHFQESVTGASSIRAYRTQQRFITESERRVDYNQIAYYPGICANRLVLMCFSCQIEKIIMIRDQLVYCMK